MLSCEQKPWFVTHETYAFAASNERQSDSQLAEIEPIIRGVDVLAGTGVKLLEWYALSANPNARVVSWDFTMGLPSQLLVAYVEQNDPELANRLFWCGHLYSNPRRIAELMSLTTQFYERPQFADNQRHLVLDNLEDYASKLAWRTAEDYGYHRGSYWHIRKPESRQQLLRGFYQNRFCFNPMDFRQPATYEALNGIFESVPTGLTVGAYFSNTLEFVCTDEAAIFLRNLQHNPPAALKFLITSSLYDHPDYRQINPLISQELDQFTLQVTRLNDMCI